MALALIVFGCGFFLAGVIFALTEELSRYLWLCLLGALIFFIPFIGNEYELTEEKKIISDTYKEIKFSEPVEIKYKILSTKRVWTYNYVDEDREKVVDETITILK